MRRKHRPIFLLLLRELFVKLLKLSLAANVLFSIVGFFGLVHQFAEMTSHFRVQYLAVACVCGLGFTLFRAWRMVAVAVACVAVNAWVVLPWISLSASEHVANAPNELRVVSSNVLFQNRNHNALIELVKKENPDVLVVQEASDHWREALKVLEQSYPFSRVAPETGRGSLMLFSRHKLEDIPLKDGVQTDFAHVLVGLNFKGRLVSLIGMHPPTPIGESNFQGRNQQFSVVAGIVNEVPQPTIVVGDFNTTMWSPYFSRLLGQTNLVPARKGFGILPTWPATFPFLMIPIDHCLVSPDITVLDFRRGGDIGSDHLPVIVDLAIRN